MDASLSGAEFKKQLRDGRTKLGLFLNSHSPTVAEQLAHSGYDWLLVDTQHGPMGHERLSGMLSGIANGGAASIVRVGSYADRPGIQQSANDNVIVALQVETADCIRNIDDIAAVPGVDMLFLGQNDLCMSMGLYEKYKFPDMYTSPELGDATNKLIAAARKNDVILGIFLFGTARVAEFLGKGFRFFSVGNDLHHILTQAGAYVKDVEGISVDGAAPWTHRSSALV